MTIDPASRPARRQPPTIAGLAALLLAGAGASLALTLALALRTLTLVAAPAPPTVDAAVEMAVTGLGAAVSGWLAASASVALACLAARTAGTSWRAGERLVQRCAPAVVRRSLVLVVGASVGFGAAAGASATEPSPTPSVAVSVDAADLGWVVTTETAPVAPSAAPTPSAVPTSTGVVPPAASVATPPPPESPPTAPTPAPTPAPAGTVVVAPGDSLWAIAARHLDGAATDAEIVASWPQWYRANAAVVGPDPNHIVPGQVLRAPDGAAS